MRQSVRSRITNRYVYDSSNRLTFVDNYIDGKMVSAEYLLYQDGIIYGVTVGMSGRIVCVSEELFLANRLESYICAY